MVMIMSDSRIEELERMKIDNQLQVEQISKVLKTKQAQARTQNNVDVSINTLIQTTQLIAEQSAKMANLALKIQEKHEDDQHYLLTNHDEFVALASRQNIQFNVELKKIDESVKEAVSLTSNSLKNEILPEIKKQVEGFEIEIGNRIKTAYLELNQCRERVLHQTRFFSHFLAVKNIIMFAFFMVLAGMFVVSSGMYYMQEEYLDMGFSLFFGFACIGFYLILYRAIFVE